ncbi:hypothetical protein HAX54_037888 [Datura stramonium]|uniref:Uncharacterized protein n=1 Tax=Datura stramonium TaxID=4076 RepID=A0ABS8VK93_DATST|nr:hypothetical protein [Datura stramonium]
MHTSTNFTGYLPPPANNRHHANASIVSQLLQPSNGTLMTNDTNDTNSEDVVPCFSLSKNESSCQLLKGN